MSVLYFRNAPVQAEDQSSPDLIVLGLQEVTMDPKQAFLDYLFRDKWSLKVQELLNKDYTKVSIKFVVFINTFDFNIT